MMKFKEEMGKINQSDALSPQEQAAMTENAAKLDMEKLLLFGHQNECTMYQYLMAGGVVPPVLIPRYYASHHHNSAAKINDEIAFLLMEDLMETANTKDIRHGLTEAQCRDTIRSLGLLQAHGIINPGWKDGRIQDVELFKNFADGAPPTASVLRNVFPEDFQLTDELVRSVAEDARKSEIINTPSLIAENKLYPVLVHGDLWSNNLLFRTNTAGETTDELAAIIDWQIAHQGSCTEDLIRVLVLCLDHELRGRIEQDMLHLYYDTLEQRLLQSSMKVPFSFDDVIKSYRKNFSIGAIIAMAYANFLVQAQQPEVDEQVNNYFENGDEKKSTNESGKLLNQKLIRRVVVAMEQAYANRS